jgi:hypothetical protein
VGRDATFATSLVAREVAADGTSVQFDVSLRCRGRLHSEHHRWIPLSGSDAVGDVRSPGVVDHQLPADLSWRKSTASGANGCVEVALGPDAIWVRDTKDRPGPALRFTRTEWDAFLAGVRQGEFDLPAAGG